jgi:hypothetical protein
MRRPFPVQPRGPRRIGPRATILLLACPKVAPDWELAAVQALIKPQLGDAIRYRSGEQPWRAQNESVVRDVCRAIREQLGYDIDLTFPPGGEYHFIASVQRRSIEEAKALAMLISRRLPEVWVVLGKLFVRNGKFYRREFGYKLKLVPATNMHLRRDIRSAIRKLLAEE